MVVHELRSFHDTLQRKARAAIFPATDCCAVDTERLTLRNGAGSFPHASRSLPREIIERRPRRARRRALVVCGIDRASPRLTRPLSASDPMTATLQPPTATTGA